MEMKVDPAAPTDLGADVAKYGLYMSFEWVKQAQSRGLSALMGLPRPLPAQEARQPLQVLYDGREDGLLLHPLSSSASSSSESVLVLRLGEVVLDPDPEFSADLIAARLHQGPDFIPSLGLPHLLLPRPHLVEIEGPPLRIGDLLHLRVRQQWNMRFEASLQDCRHERAASVPGVAGQNLRPVGEPQLFFVRYLWARQDPGAFAVVLAAGGATRAFTLGREGDGWRILSLRACDRARRVRPGPLRVGCGPGGARVSPGRPHSLGRGHELGLPGRAPGHHRRWNPHRLVDAGRALAMGPATLAAWRVQQER